MIVIVHGPDAALTRQTVGEIALKHDPSAESTSWLDGKSATLAEIIAQVASPSFFGGGRVVVVSDLLSRSSKGTSEDDATPANDSRSKRAASIDYGALFVAPESRNLLILADPTLNALPAAVRKILPPECQVIGCAPPRGSALVQWIQRAAQGEASEIDSATARFLAERLYPMTWASTPNNPRFDSPPDMDLLGSEIAKLALAAHPGPINRQHVTQLTASGDADQLFRFADAVANGSLARSLDELRKLQEAGEEPFAIAAQLYQQAELAVVLEEPQGRLEPAAIGRDLGLSNPARMNAIAASWRGRSSGTAAGVLAASLSIDRKIKRGELRDPMDGLYGLVALSAKLG